MMDTVICRMAEEADSKQVQALWSRCFDDTPDFVEWYFAKYYRAENTLGIFEKDTLQASAQVIPYAIHLRQKVLECGYVVGVDTAPEARKKGYARRLLLECLKLQRRRNQPVSLLMPFEGQFYYRYGWPFCYFHQQIKIAPNELRCAAKPWGMIRQSELFEAIGDMQRIYQSFAGFYDGYVQRTAEQWQLLLEDAALEKTRCYLIEQDGQVAGYCLWTPVKDAVFIREMAWCHEKARAGLLQFLMEQVPNNQTLWLELPDDEELVYELAAAKTSVVRYPFLMARIVDVKQCLEYISYPEEQTAAFQMKVTDSFAPWNNGLFSVTVAGGQACVEKLLEADIEADIEYSSSGADVIITIEGLSQLVLGARSVRQLCRQGLLCAEPAGQDMLQRLWPVQSLYINEYY